MKIDDISHEELKFEVEKLRTQLAEAEEILRVIRSGEVDALVVSGEKGEQVFTLKGAEKPYRILIEEMSEGAVMLAADDSILYCNSGFAGMLKIPLEKLMGTGITHYIAPVDETVFRELLRQGRESGSKGEITLLAGDGTFVSTQLSFNNLQMDDAGFVYLVATDLTDRKKMEEALRRARDELEIRVEERTADLAKSEQRWATTLASIGDAVISTDIEGRITFMNAVAEALTGWTLAEALAKPVTEVFNIINEFTRRKTDNPVTSVLQEGAVVGLANHTILVRKDGTEVPIDDSGAPIRDGGGRIIGVVLVFRDITGRKLAEQIEKEARTYAENIVETVGEPLLVLDTNLSVKTVNQAFYNTFKVSPEETIGKFIYDLGNQQWNIPKLRKLLEEIIPSNAQVQDFEVDHEFQTIGQRMMMLNARRIYKEGIGTQMILLAIEDITERNRAEEALHQAHDELELRVRERTAELQEANRALLEREASYRELTESIEDLFYAMDRDLIYTYWNKASEALTGIPAKDAIGKSLYELFPDVKGTKAEKFYIESLKTQRPRRLEVEYHLGKKKFIFEINAYPTRNGLSVIAKDITEKKNIESQLLRAQRMESLGTLASGIAHDLNNVLTPITLSLRLLKVKLTDEKSQNLISTLEKSAQRGADLIKQVLTFARGVEVERVPVQAAHIISEIEKVARETFPRNIEIRNDTPEDLWTVSGDATKLHQVIMNMCVNARYAMHEGGVLSISAENLMIDENYPRIHLEAKAGSYIVISVSDTGTGIPPEILDRIFDPFFTTKENGRGTGLGLSIAFAIVRSHNGFINVYSELGAGTVFKIYLPAVKTVVLGSEEKQFELPSGKGEYILIAEDEDPIREITITMLEMYGYKVLSAADGREAVAVYIRNKDKISLVLMDMMMPVMDGLDSIRAIRGIDPEARIIAVSGLAEKNKLEKIADIQVQAFLPKPYTADKLLKTINEVIS